MPVRKRLTELWNYERYSAPSKEGGRYITSKNDGLQNKPSATSKTHSSPQRGSSLTPTLGPRTGRSRSRGWTSLKMENSAPTANRPRVRTGRRGKCATCERAKTRTTKFAGSSRAVPRVETGRRLYYGRYEVPKEGATFQQTNVNPQTFFHNSSARRRAKTGSSSNARRTDLGLPRRRDREYGNYLVITITKEPIASTASCIAISRSR